MTTVKYNALGDILFETSIGINAMLIKTEWNWEIGSCKATACFFMTEGNEYYDFADFKNAERWVEKVML